VIAFLDWIGGIDTNGFPPKPDLALPAAVANVNLAPPPAMFGTICIACHSVGGKGGVVGPSLDGVAHRKTPQELDRWLADPAAVKPGTAMPKLPIDDSTRAALVAWLSTLN
jgi:nitric oxide reductase subunit C